MRKNLIGNILAIAVLAMGLIPKPVTDVMHTSVVELMKLALLTPQAVRDVAPGPDVDPEGQVGADAAEGGRRNGEREQVVAHGPT